jgi:hypothetical protein
MTRDSRLLDAMAYGAARLRAVAWLVAAGLALYWASPAALGPALADLSVAEAAAGSTSVVQRPAITRDVARATDAAVPRLKADDGPEPDAVALVADVAIFLGSPAGAGAAATLVVRLAGCDAAASRARGPPAARA